MIGYIISIIAIVILFYMYLHEWRACEVLTDRLSRTRKELNEEFKLRYKLEREKEELQSKCISLEYKAKNLKDTCDALASENAKYYSEKEQMRRYTVEYAFSEWERRERVDVPGVVEYERDGIVLIYDYNKMVGWRSADTVMTLFKNVPEVVPGNEENKESEGTCVEDDTQGTYEAPSAEVVEEGEMSAEA